MADITPTSPATAWTDRLHPEGRLRLRYQGEALEQESRHRFRLLAQGGLKIDLPDNLTAGFGLATGRDDPRSNNVTMTDVFRSPEIGLTDVYLAYKPTSWFELEAGKKADPAWSVSDYAWDGDLRPTGVSIGLNNPGKKNSLPFPIYFSQGAYVINEDKKAADQWISQSQLGLHFNLGKDNYLRLAGEYIYYHAMARSFLPYSSLSNSRTEIPVEEGDPVMTYTYGFNTIHFLGELNLVEESGIGLRMFGDFRRNLEAPSSRHAFAGGLTFSYKKDFSLTYVRSRIETDGAWDGQTDSDRYGGKTGTQGEEAIVRLRLNSNLELGFDFYRQNLIAGEKKEQIVGQVDIVASF
ncbi:MAG: putative porin [Candidatus Margulisiibacteriota bacterium]